MLPTLSTITSLLIFTMSQTPIQMEILFWKKGYKSHQIFRLAAWLLNTSTFSVPSNITSNPLTVVVIGCQTQTQAETHYCITGPCRPPELLALTQVETLYIPTGYTDQRGSGKHERQHPSNKHKLRN